MKQKNPAPPSVSPAAGPETAAASPPGVPIPPIQAQSIALSQLSSLLQTSVMVLGTDDKREMLKRIVDGARQLTGARLAIAGHEIRDNTFVCGVSSPAEKVPACPEGREIKLISGGVYLDLLDTSKSIRLTAEELLRHPRRQGLPADHVPLRGLLGARLSDLTGEPIGLIMLTDKESGEFTEEDEILLRQLAAIASLGLQHLTTRIEADHRAAEAAEGKRTLEAIMEYAPEGISIATAPDAAVSMVSRHGIRLAGIPEGAAQGIRLAASLPTFQKDGVTPIPPDRLPLSKAVQHGESVVNEELILQRPDGRKVPVLFDAGPIRDHFGAITGGIAVWRDITQRKESEEALRRAHDELDQRVRERTMELRRVNEALKETNEILETAFSSINFLVAYLDHDFNYLWVNRAFAESAGLPQSSFIGRNHFDIYPSTEDKYIGKQVLETGYPFFGTEKPLDTPGRGTTYWDWNLHPVKDEVGKVTGLVLCLIDRTRAVQSRNALRESQRRIQAILDNSPAIIYLIDLQGRLMLVNRQWETLFNMKRDEVLGKTVHELLPPRVAEAFTENNRLVRDMKTPLEFEEMLPLEDCVHTYMSSKFPLLDAQGVPYALCGISSDITERTRVVDELAGSREELKKLTSHLQTLREEERSNIAREIHDELGQMLTALKIDLSLAIHRLDPRSAAVYEKLTSCLTMVDSTIWSVKRICTALRPDILDHLGLAAALEWQTEEFERRTGMTCDVTVPEQQVSLGPDAEIVLFRVVQEALTNIMRHAGATHVRLRLMQQDGILVLRICDNGKGIRKDQLRKANSFGLIGMRERVQSLGGAFSIRGLAGRGTAISVALPLPDQKTGATGSTS